MATPDGINNLDIWLKADTNVYSNSLGTTPAVHNGGVHVWEDARTSVTIQLTQSAPGNQPRYVDQNGIQGVCIDYWRPGTDGQTNRALVNTTYGASTQAFTAMIVLEMNSVDRNTPAGSNGHEWRNYVINLGTPEDNLALIVNDGVLKIKVGDDIDDIHDTGLVVPSSKCVIVWRSGASAPTGPSVYVNSPTATSIPTAGLATRTGLELSRAEGAWFTAYELAAYSRALTDAEIEGLIKYAIARHSIVAAPARRIIIDGDSLSEGLNATLNRPFWRILSEHENLHVTCHAESGDKLSEAILMGHVTEINRLLAQASENWFFCKLGTNDIIQGPQSGSVISDALKAYCRDRKAAGATKVVVWTVNVVADPIANAAIVERRTDFNNAIRPDFTVPTGSPYVFAAKPGTTYADFLVDIAAHPLIGTGADATKPSGVAAKYWVEPDFPFIHLTDPGYALEAAIIGEGLFAGTASKVQGATITVGLESGANVRQVSVQLLTEDGRPTIGRQQVRLVVYQDAAGTTIATDAGSTGIGLATGGGAGTFLTLTAKKIFIATCEEDGHIDLTWTDDTTGGHAVYLGVVLPNGRVVFSEKIHNPNPP